MGTVTCGTEQCNRQYQEDRYLVAPLENERGWLLVVMDGHGGDEVSEYCAQHIGEHFRLDNNEDVEGALRRLVGNLAEDTREMHSGATLSVACVLEDRNQVSVAVVGDSPVLVLTDDGRVHHSPNHNVRTNKAERNAAVERGGEYWDAAGYILDHNHNGLQMARALGDSSFGEIVSKEPEVYTIHNPVTVLVASDGIEDPAHADEGMMKIVESHLTAGDTAEELLAWRESLGWNDNTTAVVWRK